MRHFLPMPHVSNAALSTHTPTATQKCSLIERMPKWLICIPLAIQWLWLGLRYWSLTLPSTTNPSIPSGGLVGEGKLDYFNGTGRLGLSAIATYCALSTHHRWTAKSLSKKMASAGLTFPVIAKPNVGLCGFGVQRIATMDALLSYCRAFPPHEVIVLQRYVSDVGEAGIFYLRDPDRAVGELIGLALRYAPQVIGDGVHTINELIDENRRARRLQSSQHHCNFDGAQIPPRGTSVRLATIGSTRVGGLYCNGADLITPQLTAAIDAIARDMRSFHFGRFDVRFDDVNELRAGRGFTIIEINGAGSEAIHAWDPQIGVIAAFRIIFDKQRRLFAIGQKMRRRGIRPMRLLELCRQYRRQQRLISQYPLSN